MSQNQNSPHFIITRQQGHNLGKIQTNDIVDEQQIKIIESNGGRKCNVWVFPIENHVKLYTELSDLNIYGEINTQHGIIDIKAPTPIIRIPISRRVAPKKDVFTFDLDDKEDYVSISSKLKKYYEQDEIIYTVHEVLEQEEMNPEKRYLPIGFYKSFMQQLKLRHPNDQIQETPRLKEKMDNHYHTQFITNAAQDAITCFSIKKNLYEKLYFHQKSCLEKGVRLNGRILIADEVGLGKTLSSIAIASVFSHAFPLLVVCPKWMTEHWEQHLHNWLGVAKNEIQTIKDNEVKQCKVTIMTYKQCDTLQDVLCRNQITINFKICIADESQILKNSKVADQCQLIKRCRHKIFLTGAPILSQPQELLTQLQLLQNQRLKGLAVIDEQEDLIEKLDPKNSVNCREFLQKFYMARTCKKDVKNSVLPELNRYKIQIPIDEEFNSTNGKGLSSSYKQIGQAKLDKIEFIVKKLLEEGEKVLFFAHYQCILEKIEQMCQRLKIQYIRIDSTKNDQQKSRDIKLFKKEEYRIAILSFKTASVGIDLNAASTIVFGETYFSDQSVMLQAEGRAHRIGQKQIVDCYYLVGDCKQDREMFEEIKNNYFQFSEFLNGEREDFEVTDISIDEFYKAKRHIPKCQQTKVQTEVNQQASRMTTRSQTFMKKLEKAFSQIKEGKKAQKKNQRVPIKKNIKKDKKRKNQK